MTQAEKEQLEAELEEYKLVRRPEVVERIKIARSYGDLSENSEYEIATVEAARLQARKQELLEELSNYNIITPGTGSRITLGNYIAVTELQDNGSVAGPERVFRIVRDHGDTIRSKTLSIQSPLGKAVIDGTDGIYTIQVPLGSVSFQVRKVQ